MAFSFYRTITIDATKVGVSDLTDFAVLVLGTYSYLATVANGGKVQNASGYDVGFYSDAELTTKLNWEIELYTAATGVVVYWVRIGSVSHTANTVFYMAYGDPTISTDQSNKTGVWDSSYKLVQHLAAGLSVADSTTNANNGTNHGATATTGQIDGGAAFSSQYYDMPDASTLQIERTDSATWEAWFKTNSTAAFQFIAEKGNGSAGFRGWQFRVAITTGYVEFLLISDNATSNRIYVHYDVNVSNNAWRHLVITYSGNSAGTGVKIYIDGASVTVTDSGNTVSATTVEANAMNVGRQRNAAGNYWVGSLDEIRLSKGIARGAGYVTGVFNNANSPSTFYAVGSEFFRFPPQQMQSIPLEGSWKVVGY